MTLPSSEEQLALLRATYPTPEGLSAQLEREFAALAQTMRAAAPHWHTPMPGRTWSPAQEAEHTILVNEGTGRVVRLLLSERPLRPVPLEPGRTAQGKRLAPPGTEPGPGEALETLLERHAAAGPLLSGARAAPNPERTFPHPFLGELDALDWLRMAAWHTRHHRQAIERGLAALGDDQATG
ncbi:DinB family protein [Deinococcus sp. YIM 77859]|uniref:DinB family protein n=1 Tax=Deinococcus sp. YIM 77859 TaxID=1540221 RepID=UPI000557F4B8|nr:DinB family protein [Deinococcus sp. YIM 77859]